MTPLFQPTIVQPNDIEAESFRIIDAELSPHFRLDPVEHAVIRRVIHATADFDYARNMRIHPGAYEAFLRAMKAGADIICDVQMVMAGISAPRLAKFGGSLLCPIGDPDVAVAAKAAGHTRAIEAMRKMARRGNGGVLVIGNAPTALTETIRLIQQESWRPDLVIGVPVGFVSAAESKQSLADGHSLPVPYIACVGRKGGSPCAVATVNALLLLAEGGSPVKG
ncbi:MAG: precorrin-8X methylmutase [candidate division FCPU426 bacterium]